MKTIKILLILLSLAVSACGPKTAAYGIDDEILPYLDTLDKEFKSLGRDIGIYTISYHIGSTSFNGTDQDGVCVKSNGSNYIIISKTHWDNYSDTFRLYLLAHEIGHCILGLEHNNETSQISHDLPVSVPVSIMYHSSSEPANWDKYFHEYYLKQLIGL